MLAPPTAELIGGWVFSSGESSLKSAARTVIHKQLHLHFENTCVFSCIHDGLDHPNFAFLSDFCLMTSILQASRGFHSLRGCCVWLPASSSCVGSIIFRRVERRHKVRSCERKKEWRLNISWWKNEEQNEMGKAVERRPLSSQLLWFELTESTQTSQHLTAARHAFPFLFLTWMLILARQVQQTVLPSQVFASPSASEMCSLWMTVGGRLLKCQCRSSVARRKRASYFSAKQPVCVLPQIMPDVTSLRALYMCAIHHWPGTVYRLCECSCKLLVHSTQTCWQLWWWHPRVRGWLGGGFLSKHSLHLDWTHPPTSTTVSTQGTGFGGFNLVAREDNVCFSRHTCVGVSHQWWI